MEKWRLLIDSPRSGPANMARDEAIAAVHADGRTPPALRLYSWSPPCLSLGRFQRSSAVDRVACAREGVDIVRRPSGGRALLHAEEVTYAIVAPVNHPLLGSDSILATYRQISLALMIGLRQLGAQVKLTPVERRRKDRSAACFDAPAAYELTVDGRKLVGSAQVRRHGVILQHGAIPLIPHADRLSALLYDSVPQLPNQMIALNEAIGRAADFAEVAAALSDGFAQAWGITLVPDEVRQEELELADRLERGTFRNDAWTYAR